MMERFAGHLLVFNGDSVVEAVAEASFAPRRVVWCQVRKIEVELLVVHQMVSFPGDDRTKKCQRIVIKDLTPALPHMIHSLGSKASRAANGR
jgi:hypothetical protein